jgi:hypothetical protein
MLLFTTYSILGASNYIWFILRYFNQPLSLGLLIEVNLGL